MYDCQGGVPQQQQKNFFFFQDFLSFPLSCRYWKLHSGFAYLKCGSTGGNSSFASIVISYFLTELQ
jgi:hypothetical protein